MILPEPREESASPTTTSSSLFLVLALSFHSLFEGLAVGLERGARGVWELFGGGQLFDRGACLLNVGLFCKTENTQTANDGQGKSSNAKLIMLRPISKQNRYPPLSRFGGSQIHHLILHRGWAEIWWHWSCPPCNLHHNIFHNDPRWYSGGNGCRFWHAEY